MAARNSPARKAPRRATDDLGRNLEKALVAFAKGLEDIGVDFALVGGLAVGFRSQERFTRDVDFVVRVTPEVSAEAVVLALFQRAFIARVVFEHKKRKTLTTVRFQHSQFEDVLIDVIFDLTGIESQIVSSSPRDYPVTNGLRLKVATRAHLLAMKTFADRAQDIADIEKLLEVSSRAEIVSAMALLGRIEAHSKLKPGSLVRRLERHQRRLARSQKRNVFQRRE